MIEYPIALTIAGSDSGGGAGIQADLKTFQANSVFGTSVITCVTAQNPEGVSSIAEISPENIDLQLKAVLDFFPVGATKTGMLFSEPIIQILARRLKTRNFPLVVDPVMVATSGAVLLQEDAIEAMKQEMLPIADLITPNADEASLLLGYKVKRESIQQAAQDLYSLFKVPVLLKGGHLVKYGTVIDALFDGTHLIELTSEYIADKNTHGTGCTYSSAITANLANKDNLLEAIKKAKSYLHRSIAQSHWIGKTYTLNHTPGN
jgi:hydroxymethylpyrimidine/phosphomethylpyrimidine kinase